jgi:hypothetical protein
LRQLCYTLKTASICDNQHNTMDYSDSDDSEEDSSNIVLPLVAIALAKYQQQLRPQASIRLHTGQEFVDNILDSGSDSRIRSQLRMRLDTFFDLRDWLLDNTRLKSSRYVSIEEKLFIFIHITSSKVSNRDTQERFHRSADTISR